MAKIIFLNRYFYPDHSATSQLLSQLTFDLVKEDMDIHVISSRQCYDDANAELPEEDVINGVVVHRCWTSRFGRSWLFGRLIDYLTYYLTVYVKLLSILREGDVVVAETDPPMISIIASACCVLKGARLVNWLHDLFPEVAVGLGVKGFRGPVTWTLKKLRNLSLKLATRNVVLGSRMSEYLILQGIPSNKIQIIHNWSDSRKVHPLEGINPLSAAWGTENKFVVGYSGNMGRVHDFNAILDAATCLKDESNIVFLFIGGGPQKAWVRREVSKRGLGNVFFKPYQAEENLSQSLSLPDVHLISLRPEMEGFSVPSKYYGIAAAGRASIFIGNEDGEIARIIRRDNCGLFVDQGDGGALATRISWMSQNRQAVSDMGFRARDSLVKRFDANVAIDIWKKLLREVLLNGSADVASEIDSQPEQVVISECERSNQSSVCWLKDYIQNYNAPIIKRSSFLSDQRQNVGVVSNRKSSARR